MAGCLAVGNGVVLGTQNSSQGWLAKGAGLKSTKEERRELHSTRDDSPNVLASAASTAGPATLGRSLAHVPSEDEDEDEDEDVVVLDEAFVSEQLSGASPKRKADDLSAHASPSTQASLVVSRSPTAHKRSRGSAVATGVAMDVPTTWRCPDCTLDNLSSARCCAACAAPNLRLIADASPAVTLTVDDDE
jgi:hypothetical protein